MEAIRIGKSLHSWQHSSCTTLNVLQSFCVLLRRGAHIWLVNYSWGRTRLFYGWLKFSLSRWKKVLLMVTNTLFAVFIFPLICWSKLRMSSKIMHRYFSCDTLAMSLPVLPRVQVKLENCEFFLQIPIYLHLSGCSYLRRDSSVYATIHRWYLAVAGGSPVGWKLAWRFSYRWQTGKLMSLVEPDQVGSWYKMKRRSPSTEPCSVPPKKLLQSENVSWIMTRCRWSKRKSLIHMKRLSGAHTCKVLPAGDGGELYQMLWESHSAWHLWRPLIQDLSPLV